MLDKIQNFFKSKTFQQLIDIRNIGLYIFGVIVLAVAWSGAKTVQNNYDLQKQIATLQQQNTVYGLVNDNLSLQNQFYRTNEYLELSARENLGLAAPGEKVVLVPKAVAEKYIDRSLISTQTASQTKAPDNRPKYIKNLEDWRDFLFGRKLFSD